MNKTTINGLIWYLIGILPGLALADPPQSIQAWLARPQPWQRDTERPIVSLGEAGSFDDTHIFAPAVSLENDQYQLWYCGSTGRVAERVFQLGLATSSDGVSSRDVPLSRFILSAMTSIRC